MRVEIDQSGKVEQTDKPTVLAYTNGSHYTILLPARDKRELQKIFRLTGKPRMFVIQTFSALLYLLIEQVHQKEVTFYIDTEYFGYEGLIERYLLQLILKKKFKKKFPCKFVFKPIGKLSPAHRVAHQAFKNKSVGRRITKEDVLALLLLLEDNKENKK